MKTTLDLNDALHALAKSEAARQHIPLTRFIEQAVARHLNGTDPVPSKPVNLPVFRLGLKPAFHGISLNQFYDQLETEQNLSKDHTKEFNH